MCTMPEHFRMSWLQSEEWARSQRLMQIVGFGPYPWMKLLNSWPLSIPHGDVTASQKMPFGLNQAQYFFQYYMDCHFQDINSMTNIIADDVMIHGETDEQHDRHLIQVLNKCQNWAEIKSRKMLLWAKGSQILWKHSQCRRCETWPQESWHHNPDAFTTKQNWISIIFRGMCNYLSSYTPHLSDVTATLRQLNKKKTEFTWNHTYERAFRKTKLHVANAVTLKYFNPAKSIILECDMHQGLVLV